MRNYFFLIVLALPMSLSAQLYNVQLIPDSLKKNANMVKRFDEITIEIRSPGKAIMREHYVYTILDESGSRFAKYTSSYDKFVGINTISGILYDAAGKEIKRIKKKDMQDISGSDEETLMTDRRYKHNDFYFNTYPYTTEYEEEDEINGIRGFPDFDPLNAPGVSVEISRYVIIAPKDYEVRYKPFNCSITPDIKETGDKKIYTWEMKNLPAKPNEVMAPLWSDLVPFVKMAPSDFEADGYKGNMSTWENYGKFINQLLSGREELPDDIKKKAHELTDNLKTPKEKIAALYDFLQKNTRYISIQLGIGGWQPFPANYVAAKRYGDCKALSNYMVSLLKEVGITAKYVEIWSGEDAPELVEDFPCSQSNHVVSCVPLGKDTIWLECTSQTESPGYMGSFTGGRKAILIDEGGGHIVRTPSYSASNNLQCRVVNAEINSDGNLDADVNTVYTGISQELPHALMNELSGEEREKYLNNLFNLATYKVDKSRYEEQKGMLPEMKEYLHILSPNYATVSGKRIFMLPNLFDKFSTRLSDDPDRKYDFVCSKAYRDIDSISIKIPEGYQPESIPKDVQIDSRFGKYNASVKVLPDRIIYYRSFERQLGRYPPSDFSNLVRFYEQVFKSDHTKLVLVKQS